MRYTTEHTADSRAALVTAAARVFREKGYDGVGVDGVAAAAGLTSGSLYKHFGRKAELLRAVLAAGVDRVAERVRKVRGSASVDPVGGWVNDFATLHTSRQHRAATGLGCNLPALGADVGRSGDDARALYEAGVMAGVVEMLAAAPFRGTADGEARALAVLAVLTGGAVIARGMSDGDAAERVAEAARRAAILLAGSSLPDTPRSGAVWEPAAF